MPVAQYELTNINVNRGTDQGHQQIAIRAYDEVTSLNANQILNEVAAHGPACQSGKVSFSKDGTNLITTVKQGFVAHFVDRVEHDVDGEGEVQKRTYTTKVSFDEDATVTTSLGFLRSLGTNYRGADLGDVLGVDNPNHVRASLVLQYNWEEGMLGSAVAAGGGTSGSTTLGRYANLRIILQTPERLKELIENQYRKTVFLGELLNLDEAIEDETTLHPEKIEFRPYNFGTLDVHENLRKANENFKVRFNPTGDWCYIQSGSAYIGSTLVQIPKGLSWRVRGVVPSGVRENVGEWTSPGGIVSELKTPIMDSPIDHTGPGVRGNVHFNSAGQVVDEEGNYYDPPEHDDDRAGQLDVLVMNHDGEIGWVVRPYTYGQEIEWNKALEHKKAMQDYIQAANMPQSPGWDNDDEGSHIASTLSIIRPQLDDTYLVLLILKRPYYVDTDDKLKLHDAVWPHPSHTTHHRDWILYEHNPLFPILTVPEVIRSMEITEFLTIPIQED